MYVGAHPRRVGAPTLGKSWIRHRLLGILKSNGSNCLWLYPKSLYAGLIRAINSPDQPISSQEMSGHRQDGIQINFCSSFNRWTCSFIVFTACKRSCGKLMFLHVSVILSTRGGSATPPGNRRLPPPRKEHGTGQKAA